MERRPWLLFSISDLVLAGAARVAVSSLPLRLMSLVFLGIPEGRNPLQLLPDYSRTMSWRREGAIIEDSVAISCGVAVLRWSATRRQQGVSAVRA